uniref:Uncharacterized protein n=1 Tax=Romanomermis culicivorax TaxID=13658 RepID=A0A915KT57_ROMCU
MVTASVYESHKTDLIFEWGTDEPLVDLTKDAVGKKNRYIFIQGQQSHNNNKISPVTNNYGDLDILDEEGLFQ